MKTSFYSEEELNDIGFRSYGQNIFISRKSSIYQPEAISLGNHVRIDDFCVLVGGSGITIGNYIHIGCFSAIYGGAEVIMEDFSGLSAHVTIYSESDDYSGDSLTNPMLPKKYKPKYQRGQVIIKKHVIIGANTTILPGVILHEGVAVGAHSLVTNNCKAWSIYFGCPAKWLKQRSQRLLEYEQEFLKGFSHDE